MWSSGGTSQTEFIRITKNDPNFKIGKYHIAVFAF